MYFKASKIFLFVGGYIGASGYLKNLSTRSSGRGGSVIGRGFGAGGFEAGGGVGSGWGGETIGEVRGSRAYRIGVSSYNAIE